MKLRVKKRVVHLILFCHILMISFFSTLFGLNDRFETAADVFFLLLFSVCCVLCLRDVTNISSEYIIVLASFFCQVLLLWINLLLHHRMESLLTILDSFSFRNSSILYYRNGITNKLSGFYITILNIQYHITGSGEYTALLVNAFLTTAATIIFLSILNIFERSSCRITTLFLLCFSPYIICYSIILQREAIYFF